jgi:hypothetical protein
MAGLFALQILAGSHGLLSAVLDRAQCCGHFLEGMKDIPAARQVR